METTTAGKRISLKLHDILIKYNRMDYENVDGKEAKLILSRCDSRGHFTHKKSTGKVYSVGYFSECNVERGSSWLEVRTQQDISFEKYQRYGRPSQLVLTTKISAK